MAFLGARRSGSRLLGLALLVAVACGPSKPACAPESDLGVMESQYVASVLVACQGKNYDTCEALPAMKADYEKRVAAWRDCAGEKP